MENQLAKFLICLLLIISVQAAIIPIRVIYDTSEVEHTTNGKIKSSTRPNDIQDVTYSAFLGKKVVPTTDGEIIYIPIKINGNPEEVVYIGKELKAEHPKYNK